MYSVHRLNIQTTPKNITGICMDTRYIYISEKNQTIHQLKLTGRSQSVQLILNDHPQLLNIEGPSVCDYIHAYSKIKDKLDKNESSYNFEHLQTFYEHKQIIDIQISSLFNTVFILTKEGIFSYDLNLDIKSKLVIYNKDKKHGTIKAFSIHELSTSEIHVVIQTKKKLIFKKYIDEKITTLAIIDDIGKLNSIIGYVGKREYYIIGGSTTEGKAILLHRQATDARTHRNCYIDMSKMEYIYMNNFSEDGKQDDDTMDYDDEEVEEIDEDIDSETPTIFLPSFSHFRQLAEAQESPLYDQYPSFGIPKSKAKFKYLNVFPISSSKILLHSPIGVSIINIDAPYWVEEVSPYMIQENLDSCSALCRNIFFGLIPTKRGKMSLFAYDIAQKEPSSVKIIPGFEDIEIYNLKAVKQGVIVIAKTGIFLFRIKSIEEQITDLICDGLVEKANELMLFFETEIDHSISLDQFRMLAFYSSLYYSSYIQAFDYFSQTSMPIHDFVNIFSPHDILPTSKKVTSPWNVQDHVRQLIVNETKQEPTQNSVSKRISRGFARSSAVVSSSSSSLFYDSSNNLVETDLLNIKSYVVDALLRLYFARSQERELIFKAIFKFCIEINAKSELQKLIKTTQFETYFKYDDVKMLFDKANLNFLYDIKADILVHLTHYREAIALLGEFSDYARMAFVFHKINDLAFIKKFFPKLHHHTPHEALKIFLVTRNPPFPAADALHLLEEYYGVGSESVFEYLKHTYQNEQNQEERICTDLIIYLLKEDSENEDYIASLVHLLKNGKFDTERVKMAVQKYDDTKSNIFYIHLAEKNHLKILEHYIKLNQTKKAMMYVLDVSSQYLSQHESTTALMPDKSLMSSMNSFEMFSKKIESNDIPSPTTLFTWVIQLMMKKQHPEESIKVILPYIQQYARFLEIDYLLAELPGTLPLPLIKPLLSMLHRSLVLRKRTQSNMSFFIANQLKRANEQFKVSRSRKFYIDEQTTCAACGDSIDPASVYFVYPNFEIVHLSCYQKPHVDPHSGRHFIVHPLSQEEMLDQQRPKQFRY